MNQKKKKKNNRRLNRIDAIAVKWEREHGHKEKMAYRILSDGLRNMALSIPLKNLSSSLAGPSIEANITPDKLTPILGQIWNKVAVDAAIDQRDMIAEDLGEKAILSGSDIASEIRRLLLNSRRFDLVAMTLTFSGYLKAKIDAILGEANDMSDAIGLWLAFLASREFYRYQMARIARTEVTSAANWGRYSAANVMGMLTQKTWLTMLDERVRDQPYPGFSHRVMHGITIPSNTLFAQNGVSLRFPGDPQAKPPGRAAGMIINCRCLAVYTPVRDARGRIRL